MPTEGDVALFPPSERVFYKNAPLVEVIIQLRFPPLYSVQATPPAAFQERIRKLFPLAEEASALPFPIEFQLAPEIQKMMGGHGTERNYRFLSEDRLDILVLSKESISFSTKKYRLWETFIETFSAPLSALNDIYNPSFYSRIGLRYINAINLASTELIGSKWSELFRSEILGELALPTFEGNLKLANRQISVWFPNKFGSLMLQHGLGVIENRPGASYIIDFDFHREEKTQVQDARSVLNRFHEVAGRAFRWCITDKLHDALGPKRIGTN